MSGGTTPARRLLALLAEEAALESRKRDDILADLEALGIDPAGPVRLARRLAGGRVDPAAALLDAVVEDEAAEAEIAALETADIDHIRGRLHPGTVAAATAEAQRRAGVGSNVVGIARRRRSPFWVWTGSLVGMAACALIVVAVWWPSSQQSLISSPEPERAMVAESVPDPSAPPLQPSDAAPQPEPATATVVAREVPPPEAVGGAIELERSEAAGPPPGVVSSVTIQTPEQDDLLAEAPAAAAPAQEIPAAEPGRMQSLVAPTTADREVGRSRSPVEPDAETAAADAPLAAVPPADEGAIGALTEPGPEAFAVGDVAAAAPLPPPTPAQRRAPVGDLAAAPPADTQETSALDLASALQRPAVRSEARGLNIAPTPDPADMAKAIRELTLADVLIVDPALADDLDAAMTGRPEAMRFDDRRAGFEQAPGPLSDRLEEARRLAGDRPLGALLTLRSEDVAFDAVLVRWDPALPPPRPDDPALPLLTRWFGDRASEFALFALPTR